MAAIAGEAGKNLFSRYDKLAQDAATLNANYKKAPKSKQALETYVNNMVDNGNKIVDELLDIEDEINKLSNQPKPIDGTWYINIHSKYDSFKNFLTQFELP